MTRTANAARYPADVSCAPPCAAVPFPAVDRNPLPHGEVAACTVTIGRPRFARPTDRSHDRSHDGAITERIVRSIVRLSGARRDRALAARQPGFETARSAGPAHHELDWLPDSASGGVLADRCEAICSRGEVAGRRDARGCRRRDRRACGRRGGRSLLEDSIFRPGARQGSPSRAARRRRVEPTVPPPIGSGARTPPAHRLRPRPRPRPRPACDTRPVPPPGS